MADEKMKILYLMQMLTEETDKDHPLNAKELCDRMEARHGYSYDRRTIYADIKRLMKYGMKIGQKKGSCFGYYVQERDFELPELKLLVDAVQSSKFITKEKSDDLIRKLEKQTSKANATELQRHVFILNRIKADNDSIYANVDVIHSAIRDDRQISFKYCEWNVQKKLIRRKNGADYIVSPWSLTWDDANYYLVAYDSEAGKIKHYRVDKMQEITAMEKKRSGRESFQNFDLASYARKTFGMYGGSDRKITLEGKNHFVGVVIDRFGTGIMIMPHGKDHFHANVTVSVSPQFFGWLAGLGNGVKISWPEDIREEYKTYLNGIIHDCV